MSARAELGRRAESCALDFLRARGLELVARNFRWRGGELDLVCTEGRVLVVVEVRYRSSARFGGARASVDQRKRDKLMRTTLHFLQRRRDLAGRPLRFDVLALAPGRQGKMEIDWIRDAFGGDGW